MIVQAGFGEVEIDGPFDPFAGAQGEMNARTFETYGWTFRAVKQSDPVTSGTRGTCAASWT